jgi:hypothetical protein
MLSVEQVRVRGSENGECGGEELNPELSSFIGEAPVERERRQWLPAVGEVAAPVALCRVQPCLGCAHTPSGLAQSPLWLAAFIGQLRLVTVGASLKFKIFAPNLIFHKTFIIFWIFINIFLKLRNDKREIDTTIK